MCLAQFAKMEAVDVYNATCTATKAFCSIVLLCSNATLYTAFSLVSFRKWVDFRNADLFVFYGRQIEP
jgi:hypothetical protein